MLFLRNKFNNYIILFLILELFSWLSFYYSNLSLLILIIISILSIGLFLIRPIFFLYIPLIELFWGSLGHNIAYDVFSIRLVIFVLVFIFFFLTHFFKLHKLKIYKNKKLLYIFLTFLLLFSFGSIRGYVLNNHTNVFLDANNYLYLLYLPIWYEVYSNKYLSNIITILQSATLIIAVKTIILFNLFSQNYSFVNLDIIYKWVRDTRTGEITPLSNNLSRIFFQSHFYLLVAFFFTFLEQIKKHLSVYNLIYLSLILSGLLISMSRSFWLAGLIVLILLLLFIFFVKGRIVFFKSLIILTIISFFSIITIQLFFNLPKFNSFNILEKRSVDISEPAINSRMQLLQPMLESIKENPVIGHGFGKELSYYSSDPRIKNENNLTGLHTTYSFEWGWLEMWLKVGIFYIVLFIYWVYTILKKSFNLLSLNFNIYLSIITVILSLSIINVFTPYINHPLGLWLLILSSLIIFKNEKKSFSYY